ncbi:hypothetical protein SS37A_36340 (plasmid) [Methylocystis iwaonis]|uniref:Uncharacterized protein n=1 Tax=Methylocystis iwaonis TaxID=2885079 RepID=A0ABM8EDK7_9HYPH|nr:hypothetical protein SS37A_36340 [Methylocystis iwaonis]
MCGDIIYGSGEAEPSQKKRIALWGCNFEICPADHAVGCIGLVRYSSFGRDTSVRHFHWVSEVPPQLAAMVRSEVGEEAERENGACGNGESY